MANIKTALYTRMTTEATLSGLVSTRVYPTLAPGTALLSHVVFTRIAPGNDPLMGADSSLERPWFRIDTYSPGPDDDTSEALSEALIGALNRYEGTQDGIVIQSIILRGKRDLTELEESSSPWDRISHDFEVAHF